MDVSSCFSLFFLLFFPHFLRIHTICFLPHPGLRLSLLFIVVFHLPAYAPLSLPSPLLQEKGSWLLLTTSRQFDSNQHTTLPWWTWAACSDHQMTTKKQSLGTRGEYAVRQASTWCGLEQKYLKYCCVVYFDLWPLRMTRKALFVLDISQLCFLSIFMFSWTWMEKHHDLLAKFHLNSRFTSNQE